LTASLPATQNSGVDASRRRFLSSLAGVPLLGACATPLPLSGPAEPAAGAADAARRLVESAAHHGLDSFRGCNDVNVAYDGQWRPLIDRIQPVVVDKGFRGSSEERLLPWAGIWAQSYTGRDGRKHVWRRSGRGTDVGDVHVWYEGRPSGNAGVLDAAALVADCYALFLFGPLWLAPRVDAGAAVLSGGETVRVDGRACRWVHAWVRPGLGRTPLDRVSLAIDERDRTTRRMRFTLEGYAGTRGAAAEVDTYDHERRDGVLWPMRSYERVIHPLRSFPAHDWRITGLDVNRGYGADALAGPTFADRAADPARPVRGALER
jgi:hypothetical protein